VLLREADSVTQQVRKLETPAENMDDPDVATLDVRGYADRPIVVDSIFRCGIPRLDDVALGGKRIEFGVMALEPLGQDHVALGGNGVLLKLRCKVVRAEIALQIAQGCK
jgi:hypothetical protein